MSQGGDGAPASDSRARELACPPGLTEQPSPLRSLPRGGQESSRGHDQTSPPRGLKLLLLAFDCRNDVEREHKNKFIKFSFKDRMDSYSPLDYEKLPQ